MAPLAGRDAHADRDGWIQMRVAANGKRHKHGADDSEPPCGRDDHPAAVLGVGSFQRYAGDDAVTEQDQRHRSDQLTEETFHFCSPRAQPARSTQSNERRTAFCRAA
jgi:hypothetical protein